VKQVEPFAVKHYVSDARPTIKGNGFDGLEIGEDREQAERFIRFVNKAMHAAAPATPSPAQLVAAVPVPRTWDFATSRHSWVTSQDFDDYRAAVLRVTKA